MKRFAELYRALDDASGNNEKVALIREYFRSTDAHDAAWALYLLLDKKKSALSAGALRQRLIELANIPEWLFEECRAHVGDTAETVALLLHMLPEGERDASLDALPLHKWLEEEIPACPRDDAGEQQRALGRFWRALDARDAFVLNKVLTGAFRVGVSVGLVQKALSEALEIDGTRIQHALTGEWAPSATLFAELRGSEATSAPSKPYPFMLAHPLEEGFAFDPAQWQVEYKWDGIRGQIVKREGRVYLWSRGEELVSEAFPDLCEPLAKLPDGTVLDGEILAWDRESSRPAEFAVLQTRLQRKKLTAAHLREAPAHVIAYDLIEWGGEDWREKPLSERREQLESLVKSQDISVLTVSETFAPKDGVELEALRESAREHGAEGVMLKDRASSYQAGRKRGLWWKHKREPMTVDAVLVYAQAGSGRRANLFTDYTFALWKDGELVSFAKAYSGLSDEELAELDKWIRKNTREKHGPVRVVEPVHVFELAFEGIAKSARHKSGLAVRFPRILRWRRDKPASEADTVVTAEALLKV